MKEQKDAIFLVKELYLARFNEQVKKNINNVDLENKIEIFKKHYGIETLREYSKDIFIDQIKNKKYKKKFKPLGFDKYLEIDRLKGKTIAQIGNRIFVDVFKNVDNLLLEIVFDSRIDELIPFREYEIFNKDRQLFIKLKGRIKKEEFFFLHYRGSLFLGEKIKMQHDKCLVFFQPILVIENIPFHAFMKMFADIYNKLIEKDIIPFGFIFASKEDFLRYLTSRFPEDILFFPIEEFTFKGIGKKIEKIRYNARTKKRVYNVLSKYLEGKRDAI